MFDLNLITIEIKAFGDISRENKAHKPKIEHTIGLRLNVMIENFGELNEVEVTALVRSVLSKVTFWQGI